MRITAPPGTTATGPLPLKSATHNDCTGAQSQARGISSARSVPARAQSPRGTLLVRPSMHSRLMTSRSGPAGIRMAILDVVRPHPALTSRSGAMLAVAGACAARAVATLALAARIAVRPSSIAMDTKMKLSVSAPTLIRSATSQVPS